MSQKKYTKADLLALTAEHRAHITTIEDWNLYRVDKGLPHAQTLIKHFGTWNKFKESFDLDQFEQSRPFKYTDEKLYSILEEYKDHYTGGTDWDSFAIENDLPKHFIFLQRLGPEILKEKVGLILTWSKEDIKAKILKHFPTNPPTTAQWVNLSKSLAKTEKLPNTRTVSSRFGTWNQMKYELYKK